MKVKMNTDGRNRYTAVIIIGGTKRDDIFEIDINSKIKKATQKSRL